MTGKKRGRKPGGSKALTPMQRKFVDEYLIDMNATQAATRAGFAAGNVTTARSSGSQLLRTAKVKRAIQAELDKRSKRLQVDGDRVLAELARIAFADPREVMRWGPDGVSVKDSYGIGDDAAAAVAEVSETRGKDGNSVRVKLHDKLGALTNLARHLGLLVDRHEHSGPGGGPITVRKEEERDAFRRRVAALVGAPPRSLVKP